MTQVAFYPINIEICEEGGFFAKCPVLQGCHAEGETYGSVIDTLLEVIKAHIEVRQENGEIIPSVSVQDPVDVNFQIPVTLEAA